MVLRSFGRISCKLLATSNPKPLKKISSATLQIRFEWTFPLSRSGHTFASQFYIIFRLVLNALSIIYLFLFIDQWAYTFWKRKMKKKNRKKKNSVECAVHWNGGIKFCLHSAMWQQRRRGRRRRRKALIASYINIISRFGIQRHEELSQIREDLCGRAGARGGWEDFLQKFQKNFEKSGKLKVTKSANNNFGNEF